MAYKFNPFTGTLDYYLPSTMTNVIVSGGSLPWIDVKSFGASGDGVHDDTAAIQSALDSAAALPTDVFFPSGTYMVTSQLNVQTKVGLLGEGGTKVQAGTWSSGNWIIKQASSGSGTITRFTHSNICIDLNSQPVNGVYLKRPYDHCNIFNMQVLNVRCDKIGMAINSPLSIASGDSEDYTPVLGEGFTMYNIMSIHDDNSSYGTSATPGIYLYKMNECVLTLTKAWGVGAYAFGTPGNPPNGYPTPVNPSFIIENCNGITMIQPSFACDAGSQIRGCYNVDIIAPLYESVNAFLQITGQGGNISQYNPRYYVVTSSGQYLIDGATVKCKLDIDSANITLTNNGANNCIIQCLQTSVVTNNGAYNTIVKLPTSAHNLYGVYPNFETVSKVRIDKPDGSANYLEFTYDSDGHAALNINGSTFLKMLSDMSSLIFFDSTGVLWGFKRYPIANMSCGVIYYTLDGSTWLSAVVQVGPTDSGGSGYRTLRIPN